MADYLSREAALNLIEHNDKVCHYAECLKELEDLREENKVLISECDRLIKEKGELLSKVSSGARMDGDKNET